MNSAPSADREQPSAAEFMAYITVQVCTNIELAAQARSGTKVPVRPDPVDYDISAKDTMEDEAGPPGGTGASRDFDVDDAGQKIAKGAPSEAPFPMDEKEVGVATLLGRQPLLPKGKELSKEFNNTMGRCLEAGRRRAGECAFDQGAVSYLSADLFLSLIHI